MKPTSNAPWRGGGKTNIFQSGKYPGGPGGGYSGGSNHGALMRSQSSTNQLPHLGRQRFNGRVHIKQPPAANGKNPTPAVLSKTSSKENLDLKLPDATSGDTERKQDYSILRRPSQLTMSNHLSEEPASQRKPQLALALAKKESSQLPPISLSSIPDTQATTKAKSRDLIPLDSGQHRNGLKKASMELQPGTIIHKTGKNSSIVKELRHSAQFFDNAHRKRGLNQLAMQQSRNEAALPTDSRPSGGIDEAIAEDPIADEVLAVTQELKSETMVNMAAVENAEERGRHNTSLHHNSRIEENIQVLEDSGEVRGIGRTNEKATIDAHSIIEDNIVEQLQVDEQSCEFGQFKHEVLGS